MIAMNIARPWRAWASAAAVLACCTAPAHAFVPQTDPVTNSTWALFEDTAIGLAQGYRVATAEDFNALMTHLNWMPSASDPNTYNFTTGANITTSSTSTTANLVSVYTLHTSNIPNIDFHSSIQAASPYGTTMWVTAGWLGGTAKSTLGIIGDEPIGTPPTTSCSNPIGSSPGYCNSDQSIYHTNVATLTASSNIEAQYATGTYKLLSHLNPLANYRASDGSVQAPYYMIATVPEPAQALLMVMGLGALCAVRTRRKARPIACAHFKL